MQRRHVALFLSVIASLPMLPAASASYEVVPLLGSVPPFVADASNEGPTPLGTPLDLVVVLRLRDEPALEAFAASRPRAPLSHDELVDRFAPEPATVDAATAWLASRGLVVSTVSSDRTLLGVATTVGVASQAFSVEFREYHIGGLALSSISTDPLVPLDLAPHLQAIVGLSDTPLHTHHIAVPVGGPGGGDVVVSTNGNPPFTPTDLRNAYDVNTVISQGFDGAGQDVAITGWGAPSQSSFNTYNTQYSLPSATIAFHDSSGGSSCSSTDQLEWDMDVQLEHAMSPGAAVHAYCGASATLSAMLTIIGRVVSDNVAEAISQSWGSCDYLVSSSSASSYETKFTEASAQGQAFFTSSGDGGSRECSRFGSSYQQVSPGFPATAPHTTAVAGTRLVMSGSSYSSESTWNTCTPCGDGTYEASGGGRSSHFSKPSWQVLPAGVTQRGTGDWSAVADPATGVSVRSGGSWWQVGGTSASSPLTAGIWMGVVDAVGRKGNAAEVVWPLALGSSATTILRDITAGNNGDWSAGVGYDHPTGLGSPRASGLLQVIGSLPSAPQALVATGGNGTISLSWSAPASGGGVSSYRVYGGATSGSRGLIGTAPGSQLTFSETSLAPGVRRYYAVSAVNASGEGALSAEVSARTFSAPVTAPTGLLVSNASVSQLSLSWNAPSDNGGSPLTGYRIVRSGGSPSADPSLAARLVGSEVWYLQMDADDHNAPSASQSRDSGPSGKHATLTGAAQASGRFENGYRFAGVNQYARVLDPGSMAQGTVSLWLALDSYAGGRLMFKQNPGVSNQLHLELNGDHKVFFNTGMSATPLVSSSVIPLGEWTHVAVTWGPAGRRIFVNGALDASDAVTASVSASFQYTELGNSPNDHSSGGLTGVLDEVREHNVQLAAYEVASLMDLPYAPRLTLDVAALPAALVDSSLLDETVYGYRVSALNALGEGPSVSGSAKTRPNPGPQALVATAGPGDGEISLSWEPPAVVPEPILAYRIYRGLAAGGETFLAEVGNVTSYVDAGLGNGALRWYRVAAVNATRESQPSGSASAVTFGPPRSAPALAATPGPGGGDITLSWSPPAIDGGSPVTGYRVFAGSTSGGETLLATLGPVVAYTHGSLGTAMTHYYKVSAVNSYGEGPQSAEASARTFALPGAPSATTLAAGPGPGEMSVSWTSPASNGGAPISAYRIYRAPSGNPPVFVVDVPTTPTFVDAGLANDASYAYQVSAVTIAGEGARSPVATARTFAPPGPPTLTSVATGPGRGMVSLAWSAGTTGGTPLVAYRVYGANAPGASTLLVETTATSFADSGLPDGQARYYVVRAVNAVGEGAASSEASGTSAIVPGEPRGVILTRSGPALRDLTLRWNPPAGNVSQMLITGYRVYRLDTPAGGALGSESEWLELGETTTTSRVFTDRMCLAGETCAYRVTTVGVAGESVPSTEPSQAGASAGVATPGFATDDPRDAARLIGHELFVYQFDSDDETQGASTRDSSTRANHARTSSPGPVIGAGKFGQGYRFYANNRYLGLRDADLSNLESGTVMFWLNVTAWNGGGIVLHKALPGVANQLIVSYGSTGIVAFGTSSTLGSTTLLTPSGTLPLNRWTHVAVTWGPEGKRIYVDGALAAQNTDALGTSYLSHATEVGVDTNNHAGTGMRANLDELRGYDVALSQGDIRDVSMRPYVVLPVG